MYFNQCSKGVIFHGGNLPDFFFCRGFVSIYFVFLNQWWLGRDGNDLAKVYFMVADIYTMTDVYSFVCWNGSRKLQTSSVLFQNQMFPTLRFLNFIDRSDTLAHVFFRLILGRTLALSLRPLASVFSFLCHEGTTFSLKFICSFFRFISPTYGSYHVVMHGQVFCSPFPMAQSHMVDASSLGSSFKGKCSTSGRRFSLHTRHSLKWRQIWTFGIGHFN